MIGYIIWFHYLFINLLCYHKLPCWLLCDGDEWFNCVEKCYAIDCNWHIHYSSYVSGELVDLLVVEHRSKYVAYLLMIFELFRYRDKLSYGIDYL